MNKKQLRQRLYKFIQTQLDERGHYQTYLYPAKGNPQPHPSVFVTSLIVRLLASDPSTINLAKKSIKYLRSQLNPGGVASYWEIGSWQFKTLPPDLDDSISIYRALYAVHQITAKEYLQSLQLLFKQEVEPGGPYYTWITNKVGVWLEIDTGVNGTIADYLGLQEISLKPLNSYLKKSQVNRSRYYIDPIFEHLFSKNPSRKDCTCNSIVVKAAQLFCQKNVTNLTDIHKLLPQVLDQKANHGFIKAKQSTDMVDLAGSPAFTASLILLSLMDPPSNPLRNLQYLLEDALYQPLPCSLHQLHTQIFDHSQNIHDYIDDRSNCNFLTLLQSNVRVISQSLSYIQRSRYQEITSVFCAALDGIENREACRNYPLLISTRIMTQSLKWSNQEQRNILSLIKNVLTARLLLDDLRDANQDSLRQLKTPVTIMLQQQIPFTVAVQTLMKQVSWHRRKAEKLAHSLEHRLCRSKYLPALLALIQEAEQKHRLYLALRTE